MLAAVGGFLLAWHTVLQSDRFKYIRMRFLVVLDHDLDPLDKGFHQNRSLLALGSGQFTGQGYLNGTQTQAPYSSALPARHTDFIFSAIGEELGFVGCGIALILLIAIIARCIWVGNRSQDYMRRLICYGAAAALIFQTLINIGMCTRLLPVIGITLPFISYGGTSILFLMAEMGIVLSVSNGITLES